MSPTSKKSVKSKKNTTKGHWKHLQRDSRGRWVKQPKTKGITKSKKKIVTKPKEAEKILDKIEKKYEKICPRCAGDLKFHTIRCGPEKLVKVRRCAICNFWLPISE